MSVWRRVPPTRTPQSPKTETITPGPGLGFRVSMDTAKGSGFVAPKSKSLSYREYIYGTAWNMWGPPFGACMPRSRCTDALWIVPFVGCVALAIYAAQYVHL